MGDLGNPLKEAFALSEVQIVLKEIVEKTLKDYDSFEAARSLMEIMIKKLEKAAATKKPCQVKKTFARPRQIKFTAAKPSQLFLGVKDAQ